MSQPLLATFRMVINYRVAGVNHAWRGYCFAPTPTVGAPDILQRDGVSVLDWTDAANYSWDQMRTLYNTGSIDSAQAVLEQFADPVWNPISFHTLTGGGASSASQKNAQQITYVLRDTAFFKLRFILLETVQGYTGHVGTGYGLGTDQNSFTEKLDGTETNVNAFWNWQKSRGNRYFLASGTVAGLTFDLNDKLKRRRGLE
jgi:hypothetical protein